MAPLSLQAPTPKTLPVRLQIDSIHIDAPVENVGLTPQGAVAVPVHPSDAGWYGLGSAPGEAGDVLLDGHLDWWTGPAVFANLGSIPDGAVVVLTDQLGQQYRYSEIQRNLYPYQATDIPGLFASSGASHLTLVTCAGVWNRTKRVYSERLVVTAIPLL